MTFAEILNQELKKQKISQKELADRTNMTETSVSRYCNGNRTPTLEALVKIADELHVSTDYLLGRHLDDKITLDNIVQKLDTLSNDMSLNINDCMRYHSAKLTIRQIYNPRKSRVLY